MQPDEYRKLALIEDGMWYFRALHAHCLRELARHLDGRAAAEILDAGCGTGGFIRFLARERPAWQVTGVDASDLACGLARERTKASIVQANLERLPFADGSFDAVVTADVLYHVEDDRQALREIRRVLRPGGIVVYNVPAYRWLWSYHDVATESRRRYSKGELKGKLRDAELTPRVMTYWNTVLFPLIAFRRKVLPAPKGGSDVSAFPPPVDRLFDGLMGFERLWLKTRLALPFGSSLFGVSERV